MHSTQFVRLSFRWYAFWWIAILGVHLVATAYNAAFVAFYWHFGDTFLSYTLESDKIGLPRDHFHTIAYVYMGLVIIHGQLALSMVIGSLRYHKLTFSVGGSKINMHRNRVSPNTKPESMGGEQTTNSCCAFKFVQYLSVLYHKIAGRGGLLGVDGKYFHFVIICRELLQETLQTVQAFRMSKHLPRPLLNRFYVSLVAVNCWSTLFVSSRWFWKDEARRRFAVIGCDILLDLMSTLGIQLIIVLHYWDLFHIEILAFNFDSLGDEAWGA
ncbi:unnamed protein product [Phytophthora lilii]|uniref:Unnamed protein product n=1 Tax=Phytophthora lilii TaxID=2077276 RepID=A0A9W6WS94_9STRA|nr:unnamed protein product [Phytophthora lilii]